MFIFEPILFEWICFHLDKQMTIIYDEKRIIMAEL